MLVLQVLAGCPTILHSKSSYCYIFNAAGLYRVDLTNNEFFDEQYQLKNVISLQYWCLVDCNHDILDMPHFLSQSCTFILQAASPQSDRIDWVKKYNFLAPRYFMKNWPLDKLIMGWENFPYPVLLYWLLSQPPFARCREPMFWTKPQSILHPVCSIGMHGLHICQQSGSIWKHC